MFIPYSIVNPLTTVRIPRRLPRPGELLIRLGEAVEPARVVAQTVKPADFCIIDVARELNVPVKKVKEYLKVTRGAAVGEGDVLASRGGLGGQVCRAPINGSIMGSGRGRLLLEADPQTVHVAALVPGLVVEASATEGVVIEATGAFMQMGWGNGKEAFGVLRVVVRAPRHPIRTKHIDAAAQGAILVGGSHFDEETLEQAIEMQVRGMIVGGIPPSMIPRLEAVEFPIVTTEGISTAPMSQAFFDLLRSLDGREVSVSGRMRHRWETERPYVMVPMPARGATPVNPEAPLVVGSRVRVLRGPYTGTSGVVSSIPKSLIQLETGARLPGVQVDLGGKEFALVPFMNLERLL
jgi:transcription antitermination factor NusG